MPGGSETAQPEVLGCPKCGAQLARGALGCGHCGSEFVEAVGAMPEKSAGQVVERNRKFEVGDICFLGRHAFSNEQLTALAGQVTAAMFDEQRGEIKHYFDFSLPIPKKPGRPAALLVQALRSDDPIIKVSFMTGFGPETHQRLQDRGRVLSLPENV